MKPKQINMGILISLEDLFPNDNPKNKLEFIKKYPKEELLMFFAGLNCFYPRFPELNYTQEEHFKVLALFLDDKEKFRKVTKLIVEGFNIEREKPGIFSRQANLFSLEEILSIEDENLQNDVQIDSEDLLKYYLSVNSEIRKQQDIKEKENIFEYINTGIGSTIETELIQYPLQEYSRSLYLIDFLRNHHKLKEPFEQYWKKIGLEPEIFLLSAVRFAHSIAYKKDIQIPLCGFNNTTDQKVLEILSSNQRLNGVSILEAANIKKSPIFKLKDGGFLILDSIFIFEKCYKSMLFDLWYDSVKRTEMLMMNYMGEIGLFFEEYVGEIIKRSFHFLKYPTPKITGDLEIYKGKKKIELADFYVRHNKKILLGQVKCSFINSETKYNGDVEDLYSINSKGLYEIFGLNQMINSSINNLIKNPELFESKLLHLNRLQVYPILVCNEKFILTPFVNLNFQEHMVKNLEIKFPNGKINSSGEFIIKIKTIESTELSRVHFIFSRYAAF